MGLETILLAIGVWLAITVAGLALVALVVASLPPDYFSTGSSPSAAPPGALGRRIARNVAGVILIALGLVLSVPGVPGQGVLTVLAGVILVDFPGRVRIVRALARRRGVLSTLNRLRGRLGRPPLLPPDAEDDERRT